nr:MAG: hypothetical protein [Lake Baikal virophage 13]
MSVYGIINDTTGKIFDSLIPQGGGVNLTKGQLISANNLNVEVAVPVGANGSVLSADSTQADGLSWIAIPAAIPLAQGQLISANLAGGTAIVPAPQLPVQANWVLTADSTAGVAGTNMLWKPTTGAGGIIDATAPLVDVATQGVNTISIGFTAGPAGQIPYGNGTANTGALTNTPVAGQILGVSAGIPAWIPAGGSGTITATAPLTEYAVGASSNIAIDFVAKGDLVVGGGAQVGGNPIAGVILPVGANDLVLTCNSNTASGLEWVASGAGSSATIFRNSVDNVPLVITPPATSNDTCVITADRTYHDIGPINIMNNVGSQGLLQNIVSPFLIQNFTPTGNTKITNITATGLYIQTSSPNTPSTFNLCEDGNPNVILMTGNVVNLQQGAEPYNFVINQNPIELAGGTQYSIYLVFTATGGDNYNIETAATPPPIPPTGDFTGVMVYSGEEYSALTATFTLTAPNKFRLPNDLIGKTSATCESFASQSFVATGQQSGFIDWIMVGAQSGGVAFIP